MSDITEYRPGDSIVCPSCGRESAVKLHRKMDGWTCVGEFFICALCKAELAPAAGSSVPSRSDNEKSVDALADFFGTTVEETAKLDVENSQFCRDCIHYYSNPFASQCMLHERKVEPMQDCGDFSLRPLEPTTDDGASTP
ncbi:MAG: hypothetical protein KAI66_01930 [Lentisphaeria bacterium]|nr:hypothetical protein [Lentisphaeria bacterium]